MLKKILQYLQQHPYEKAIGTIIGVIGLLLGIIFWLFPRASSMPDDVVITAKTPTEANETQEPAIFLGSIFKLAEDISLEQITMKKSSLVSENIGLKVTDQGYITDVKRESVSYDDEEYTIQVDIAKDSFNDKASISCFFTERWEKSLLSVDFSDKVTFTGKIAGGKNYKSIFRNETTPLIALINCSILETN